MPKLAGFIALLTILTHLALSHQSTDLTVPQTFGFMTMTHARSADNSLFQDYIQRYALMDCPLLTQINIIWNNDKTPQSMGVFLNSQNWKRPINFYHTPHNSLDWRYVIPPESKTQVYFSIDDDIIISCQELTKGFKVWQANAIGQIGPIVTYSARYFDYVNGKGFNYGIQPTHFYNYGLIGYAFVSRHFMQLYYADVWELSQMRKVVVEMNNCEDIGLEWLTEYFYPQLQTIVIKGQVRDKAPPIGLSTATNHLSKRSECIRKYTEIFGVNVLRYRPVQQKYPDSSRWNFPFKNKTVTAKKRYLQKHLLLRKNDVQSQETDRIDWPFEKDQSQADNKQQISNQQDKNMKIDSMHSAVLQTGLSPHFKKSITPSQYVFLYLVVQLAIICLLILFCLSRLKIRSPQPETDPLKMKYTSLLMPQQTIDFLLNDNSEDNPKSIF